MSKQDLLIDRNQAKRIGKLWQKIGKNYYIKLHSGRILDLKENEGAYSLAGYYTKNDIDEIHNLLYTTKKTW